jgi:hypothetical protein
MCIYFTDSFTGWVAYIYDVHCQPKIEYYLHSYKWVNIGPHNYLALLLVKL